MKRVSSYIAIAAALIALTIAATPAQAESVLTVIAIDTKGNTAEYLKRNARTLEIAKSLAPGAIRRVWVAQYSGASTGTIYVTTEWESDAARVKAQAITSESEEFLASIAALREMGSVVISQSLLRDVTPE